MEADLKARLHVAIAIAKTLCDHHDAGVYHNNVSDMSNIIVETYNEGRYCSVTLIDLAKSVLVSLSA